MSFLEQGTVRRLTGTEFAALLAIALQDHSPETLTIMLAGRAPAEMRKRKLAQGTKIDSREGAGKRKTTSVRSQTGAPRDERACPGCYLTPVGETTASLVTLHVNRHAKG